MSVQQEPWHEDGTTCECHPECRSACRTADHPVGSQCLWPDCLTPSEMRAALIEMAGDRAARPDPVILASHADHPLAGQVQAVLDEEGVDGVAEAIRRVARGEGTS